MTLLLIDASSVIDVDPVDGPFVFTMLLSPIELNVSALDMVPATTLINDDITLDPDSYPNAILPNKHDDDVHVVD